MNRGSSFLRPGSSRSVSCRGTTRQFRFHPSSSSSKKCSPYDSRESFPFRSWHPPGRSKAAATSSSSSGFPLSVMSYNILSDLLYQRHPELYLGCNKKEGKWKSRWPRILNEIKRISPDVLALQEVQSDHFQEIIYKDLKGLSYEGFYKKRTGQKTPDGLALFYKPARLSLIEGSSLEFNQSRPILDRDNVALIGHFRAKGSTKSFLLATTHLLYNPKRFNTRLAQSALLAAELERLSAQIHEPNHLPIILTGDFNSEPHSLVHQFWSSGRAPLLDQSTSFCLRSLGLTSNCVHEHTLNGASRQRVSPYLIDRSASITRPKTVPFNPYESPFSEITHGLNLNSTERYDSKGVTSQQHNGWVRVDYIFYAGPSLKLLEALRSPLASDMSQTSIPGRDFPSDHISQVAKFILS